MRPNRTSVAFLLTILVAGVSGQSGRAQTPTQEPAPPVFTAGTTFVTVDVYPRRDGQFVDGLEAGAFQVFENGKPQAVASFELVRMPVNPPDSDRRDPNSVQDGFRQAADPHNRVFVVYLDLFHVDFDGSRAARTPVVNFLARSIGPNDLFAVMTPATPVSALTFGRRIDTIEYELTKYSNWGQSNPDRLHDEVEVRLWRCAAYGGESLMDRVVRLYREDKTATHLEDLITRLGQLRDERKNLLLITGGWNPRPAVNPTFAGKAPAGIPSIGTGPDGRIRIGNVAAGPGTVEQAWCNAQMSHLMGIDFQRRFLDLLELARRRNVTFYPVKVGRLDEMNRPSRQDGPLVDLAENTDGRVILNTNDIARAMRAITDDLSAYYLLGYYSTNPASDGRFRRIDVKVNVPGVKVTARRGYFASSAADRRAEEEAALRAAAAMAPAPVERAFAALGRLPSDSSFYTSGSATTRELAIVAEISSREAASGRWKNGGTLTVRAMAAEGGTATVSAESLIDPGAQSALIRIPLGPATAGVRAWRVTTKIRGTEAVLDDGIDVAVNENASIGPPLVFRAGSAARSPATLTADPQFSRTEQMRLEWRVRVTDVPRTVRLLGRRGDQIGVPLAFTTRENGNETTVLADMGLASVAPGDYVMEITAGNGDDSVTGLFAFRVVR